MPSKPTLYLIRGAQGSGKTTLAKALIDSGQAHIHLEADMFFEHLGHGEYLFDDKLLGKAHDWLRRGVELAMKKANILYSPVKAMMMFAALPNIVVAGTLTSLVECETYHGLAREHGYTVNEIICRGQFENVHGVPAEIVQKKRDGIEL